MEMTIRPLESRSDWEKAVENQVLCREPQFSARSYRRFRRAQMARYKAMAAKGLGAWYGAFRGDDLVADLGIIANAGLGRYQSVQTHPEFRRKGIGGELVYSAGVHAQTRFGIQTLVIVAEADSPAEGLYRSIGFHFREHQLGLERFPARD
jgi:GNAT superfamily N-acetyltransferase